MNFNNVKLGKFLSILAILLLGIILYSNTLQSPFLYDDGPFILNNPLIYHPENIRAIWEGMKPMRFVGTYSFALDYYFYKDNVSGYHLTNIVIHIGTAFMVWWFTLLTLSSPKLKESIFAQKKEWLAFFTGLLFVSHPIATMAVNHITQRYTSLVAFFYLGSLCFYIQWRLLKRTYSLLGAIVLALMAALTKQSAVTLPFIIILYECCFLDSFSRGKRVSRIRWLSIGFFFLCSLIIVLMNFKFDLLNQRLVSQSHEGDVVTSYTYLLTQFRVIPIYIKLLFFPKDLNFDYDFSLSQHFFEVPTLLGFVFLSSIIFLGIACFNRHRLISFGIGWFFITQLVESSILPIAYVIVEYRVYLPLVGFCLLLCTGLFYTIKNFKIFVTLMCFIILIFSFWTWERNKIWQNEIAFWQDAVTKSPNKSRPYDNLGAAYLAAGDYPQALMNLKKASELGLPNFINYNNLISIYMHMGQLEVAQEYLNAALKIDPHKIETINNLGLLYLKQNDIEKAEQAFLRAANLKTGHIEPNLNLANIYQQQGRIDEAINVYEQILNKALHHENVLCLLAELYLKQPDRSKIVHIGQEILKKVNDPRLLTSSGSLFAMKGYSHLAMGMFSKSLEKDSRYIETYLELGKLLGNMNQFDSAISIWEKGLKLDSKDLRLKELIQKAETLKLEIKK